MSPSGSCFITQKGGYFRFIESFSSEIKAKLLGAIGGKFLRSQAAYDSNGKKWKVKEIESRYKKGWWLIFLANTVYNPRIAVNLVWNEPKPYKISELKDCYIKAVNQDDDLLTQFVEAAELREKILAAETFQQLVDVYKWMQTDHSDETPE